MLRDNPGSTHAAGSSRSLYSFMAPAIAKSPVDNHVNLIDLAEKREFDFLGSEILLPSKLQQGNIPSFGGKNIFDAIFANKLLNDMQRAMLIKHLFTRGYGNFYQRLMCDPYLARMLEESANGAYNQLVYDMYSWLQASGNSDLIAKNEMKIWFALLATHEANAIFISILKNASLDELTLKIFVLKWLDTIDLVDDVRLTYEHIKQSLQNTKFAGIDMDLCKYAKQRMLFLGKDDASVLAAPDINEFLAQHRNSIWSGGWGTTSSSGIAGLLFVGKRDQAMEAYAYQCEKLKKELQAARPSSPP